MDRSHVVRNDALAYYDAVRECARETRREAGVFAAEARSIAETARFICARSRWLLEACRLDGATTPGTAVETSRHAGASRALAE
jgi:hypothetical protein